MTELPDLSEVLDHYEVQHNVNRTGNQSIRCPVHEDAHASASCNLGKQVWNCHACGEGGTSVNIIMLREGIDYKAALAFGKRFTQGSNGDVRTERGKGTGVPAGTGYRPRYFRAIPNRPRQRPDYGS